MTARFHALDAPQTEIETVRGVSCLASVLHSLPRRMCHLGKGIPYWPKIEFKIFDFFRENRMVTYTVSELVPLLKLKPRAVRKLLASGSLQGKRVGRQWIVSEYTLRSFLGENKQHECGMDHRCVRAV